MLFLLWFSSTVGEGRLWERLRIYSGKYLFNKSKFYLDKLNRKDVDRSQIVVLFLLFVVLFGFLKLEICLSKIYFY
jgi:hypothetical protein